LTDTTENESSLTIDTSPQTIIPLIIPSFDDSSSNILQTNQISTTIQEKQIPSNNNEYINPRGIRFTTASPTNESVKGKKTNHLFFQKKILFFFILFRFINSIWLALCSWSLSFSHHTY
jgi:hypothetical protein